MAVIMFSFGKFVVDQLMEFSFVFIFLSLSIVCFVSFSCFEKDDVVDCHVKVISLVCLIVVFSLFGHYVGLRFSLVFLILSFST